ncbi:hypothetical protein A3758_38225 [Oleiphilus sp. HI0118]|nr:hypothetical protein A3758_38225 [Oleiphilus sp. HI0118]
MFPDFSDAIAQSCARDGVEQAELLLSEAGVALVPGSAFGSEGCMRLSFATSMETLEAAVARIKKVLG